MKSLTFLFRLFIFFFLCISIAYSQSWYVDKNSSVPGSGNGTQQNPFKTISAAIAAANAWGANPSNANIPKTIFIAPATYTGDINLNITTSKLTIIGKPKSGGQKGPEVDAPIIDGENQIGYIFSLAAGVDSITITGLYFKNVGGTPNAENPQVAGNNHGTAINAVNILNNNSNFIRITHNHFENINTPIFLTSPGQNVPCPGTGSNPNILGGVFNNLLIQNNIIKTASNQFHGIYLENVSNALIDNNTIEGNSAVSSEVGLEIAVRNNSHCPNAAPATLPRNCSNVTISNNTFLWNQHCNLVLSIRVNKNLVSNFQNTANTVFQNIFILNNTFRNNNSTTTNLNANVNDYLWGGRIIRLSDYGVIASSLQNITIQNNTIEYFISRGNNFDLPSNTGIYIKDAKGENNFNINTFTSSFAPLTLSVAAETDATWINTFRSVRPGAFHALSFDYKNSPCNWEIKQNTFTGHDINKANDVGAAFQFYYLNQTSSPVSQTFNIEQNYVSKFKSAIRLEYWLLGSQLSNISFRNNHLAGNRVGVVNNSRNIVTANVPSFTPTTPRQGIFNASFNWWGDNNPQTVANYVDGVQSVGGSSGLCPFAPGTTILNTPQPSDLIFSTLPNVDYTPWLDNGNDVSPSTPGFQGDFSYLHVDRFSPQAPDSVNFFCLQSGVAPVLCNIGSYGRVGEALENILDNGTIMIYDRGLTAFYSEDYMNQVTKNVKFASNGTPIIDNLRINTVNSQQKLTLLAPININKLLDLQMGKIEIGNYDLTLVCYPQVNNGVPVVQPIISGGSENSYVVTEGSGMLRRDCVGGGSSGTNNAGFYNPIKYAVGTSQFYAPVTLRNTLANSNLAPDRFGVRVVANVYAVPTIAASPFSSVAKATWFINEACPNSISSCTYTPGVTNFPNTFPNNDVTLTFEWPASLEGLSFNRNSCYVKEYTSNGWIAVPDAGGQPAPADGVGPYRRTAPALTGQFINKAFAVFSDCPSPPIAPATVARCDAGPLTITFSFGPPSNPPVTPNSLLVYTSETGGVPIATFTTSPATFITPPLPLGTSQQYWIASSVSAGCESKRVRVIASATGNPASPIINNTTLGLCQAGSVVFTALMGTSAGNAIHLVTDVGNPDNTIIATSTTPNANGEYLLTTPFLTQTTTYGIYATALGGCKSQVVPVQAIIAGPPGSPSAPNVPICGGGSVTITATMGNPPGNQIRLYANLGDNTPLAVATSAPYLLTASTTQTVTWYLESYNTLTSCASTRVPVTVTVNNEVLGTPIIQASNLSRCGPGEVTFTAIMGNPAGNQFRIYDASSGGNLLGTFNASANVPTTISVNIPQSGTYYIASYNTSTGCESARLAFSVSVSTILGTPSAANVARCGAGNVVFTAAMGQPAGSIMRLYTQNVGGVPISVSTMAPYQLQTSIISTTTTFYLASATPECESFRTPIVAIIHTLPSPPIVPNVFLCNTTSQATFNATFLGSNPQELRVYSNNNGQIGNLLATDAIAPYQYTTSGVITQNTTYWFSSLDLVTGCESEAVASSGLINMPPPPPSASDVQRCGPGPVTITVSIDLAQANGVRLFTQPVGGNPVSSDFVAPYEVSAFAETNVTWFVEAFNTATQCASTRVPVNVRLLSSPIMPQAQNITRCGAGMVTFTISNLLPLSAEVRLYTSTDANIPIAVDAIPPYTLTTGFNNTGITSYYIAHFDNSLRCESIRVMYTVNAIPLPSPPTFTGAVSRCGAGAVTFSLEPLEPGMQVNLYTSSVNGAPIASISSPPLALSTPFITTTTVFYLEKLQTSTNCASARIPITAQIQPIPAEPRVSNITICEGGVGTFSVSAGNPSANEAYLYTSESASIPFSGDIIAPFTLETPNISTSTIFYIALLNTATGCFSNRLPVLAKVAANPSTPTANNVVRCGAGSVTITALVASPNNMRINVFTELIEGRLVASKSQAPYELTIANVTTQSTFYLQAENTETGCKSPTRFPVTVTINTILPSAPQVVSVSRCGSGSVTFTVSGSESNLETRLYTAASGGVPIQTTSSNPAFLNTPLLNTTTRFWIATFNPLTACESPRVQVTASIINRPGTPIAFDTKRCGAGQVVLTAFMNAPAGTEIRLYDAEDAQIPLNSANNSPFELLTPFTNATQTYYLTSFNENTGCESDKVPVIVSIELVPAAPSASTQTVCGINNRARIIPVLNNPLADQVLLYTQSTGGMPISTNSEPPYELLTPAITTSTTFYLEGVRTQSQCTSQNRTPVLIVVSNTPAPGAPTATSVSRCGAGIVTITATMGLPTGNLIRLFNAPLGGQLLAQDNTAPYEFSISISTTTTFFISSQNTTNGCESERVEVVATIHAIPDAPIVRSVSVCQGARATITAIMGAVAGSEIRIYNRLSAGTLLAQDNLVPYEIELGPQNVTTTYFIESITTATGCASSRVPVVVSVNTPPFAPSATVGSLCNLGSAVFSVNSASVGNANEVRLYDSEAGANILASDNTLPFELVTPTLFTSTTFYIGAVNTNTGCEGPRTRVVATVTPELAPPRINNVSRCGPGSVTLTGFMNLPAGNQIRLYDAETGGNWIATATGAPYLLVIDAVFTTTTFYASSVNTNNGCQSIRTPVVVTIHPSLVTPTAVDISRCGAGAVTISLSNSSNLWSEVRIYSTTTGGTPLAVSQNFPFELVLPRVQTSSVFYLEAFSIATGCSSLRSSVAVNIRSVPSRPAAMASARCGEGVVSVTASMGSISATEMRLYTQISGGNPINSASNFPYFMTTPYLTASTQFFVSAFDATTNCESERVAVTAIIHPIPGEPSFAQVTRCGSGVVTFTVTMGSPAGNELALYEQNSGGIAISTDNISPYELISSPINTTTTFFVESRNTLTGCTSGRRQVIANILPIPAKPTVFDVRRCGAGSVTLTVTMNSPAGNAVRVYADAVSNTLVASTNTLPFQVTLPFVSTNSAFYVSAFSTTNSCESERVKVEVIINAIPSLPSAFDVARCGAGSLVITAEMGNVVGTQIRLFSLPTLGNVLSVASTPPYELVTPVVNQTTTFFLEVFNSSTDCRSGRRPVVTAINPFPTPVQANDVERCGTGVVTLTARMGAIPGNQILLYTVSLGGQPIAQDNTFPFELSIPELSSTTSFYLESINTATGCTSTTRTLVNAIVRPIPQSPTVNTIQRCGQGVATFSVLLPVISSNQEVRLYTQPTGGLPIAIDRNEPFLLSTPSVNTTTTFFIATTLENCESERALAVVNINSAPSAPIVRDLTRCGAGAVSFSATFGEIPGTEFRLYNTPEGGQLITSTSESLITLPFVQNTTTYYLSAAQRVSGSITCESERIPFVVQIRPIPLAPNVNSQTRCGPGVVTLSIATPTGFNGEFVLYTQPVGGNIIQSLNSPPYTFSLNLTTTNTYFIASRIQDCEGERTRVVVSIRPVPDVPSAQNTTRCGTGPISVTANMGIVSGNEMRLYDAPQGGSLLALRQGFPWVLTLPLLQQTTTFYLASALGECESERIPVVASVFSTPSSPTVSAISRCGPGRVTITATMGVIPGTGVRVYDSEFGSNLLASRLEPPFEVIINNISVNTTLFVAASIDNCESPRIRVPVRINLVPSAPVSNNLVGCNANSFTITAAMGAIAGTQMRLYSANFSLLQTLQQSPYTFQVNPPLGVTSYYLTAVSGNCESEKKLVEVTNLPSPVVPNVANINHCGSGLVTLTVTLENNIAAEVRIYDAITGGNLVVTDNTFPYEISLLPPRGTTTYYASSVIGNCESIRRPVVIRSEIQPDAPVVNSNYRLCDANLLTITVNTRSGSITEIRLYDREVGGNLITRTSVSPYLITLDNIEESVTYYLAAANSQCESNRVPVIIDLLSKPSVPIANIFATCISNSVELELRQGAIAGDRFYIYTSSTALAPIRVVEGNSSRVRLNDWSSGEVFVSASNRGICESNRVRLVVPSPISLQLSTNVQNETCAALGSITATLLEALPPVNYRLFSGGTLVASNTSGVFTGLNSGTYQIEATDARGCMAVQSLVVQGMPTPSAISFVQKENDLELNWESIEGAQFYIIQYRFLPDGAFVNPTPVAAPTTRTLISGLVPNLEYEFQMRAICKEGRQTPLTLSQIFRLRGHTTQNCSTPRGLNVQNQSAGALLSWLAVPGAQSYNVQYRALPNGTFMLIPSVSNTSVLLQGLQGNTNYEVNVTANCANGLVSEPSEVLRFTTPAIDVPNCQAPSNVAINVLSNTSALVNWQAVPSAAICYIVSYGITGSSPTSWVQTLVPHPTTSIQLTNLQPNTSYSVQLQTNCSLCSLRSGNRSLSTNPVSFVTTSNNRLNSSPEDSKITIYPNPFTSTVILTFDENELVGNMVRILDLKGKEVSGFSIQATADNYSRQWELDLSGLPAGIYFLELEYKYQQKVRQKVVKF